MTFVLSQSNYGKSAVRLVKVVRDEEIEVALGEIAKIARLRLEELDG